jgi:hypothetical protein
MFAGQFVFSTWLYTTHVIQIAARIKKTELNLKTGTSFTENHENKKTDNFRYEFWFLNLAEIETKLTG